MDYEMGLKLADRALERDPDQTQLRIRQAAVLWKLDRREVAWMAMDRVLKAEAEKSAVDRDWEAPTLAAFWRYLEGKPAEAEVLAKSAKALIDKRLRPDLGAKWNWPEAFAPGLREIEPGEKTRIKSQFPLNAGLPSYILGCLQEARSGMDAEAAESFRKAMNLSYEARDCILRIGFGRLKSGNFDGAIAIALTACDAGGPYPDFYFLAAAAAEAKGDRRAAFDYLEIAVELKPFVSSWLKALAVAGAENGQKARAEALLRRVLKLDPDDYLVRDQLDGLERALMTSEFSGALAAAVAGLQRDLAPRWRYPLNSNPSDIAAIINNRFLRFLQEGQVYDAARYLDAFLDIEASSPALHYNLAQLDRSLGRSYQTVYQSWTAVALRPDYPDGLDALARSYFDLGDFERAILCYREALRISPDDPTACFNLGCALQASGDLPEAEAMLGRAIELDEADTTARRQGGNATSGVLAHEVDVKVDPISYRALLLLGGILEARGDAAGAAGMLEKAVRLKPEGLEAYLALGKACLALGEAARAKSAFEKYLALGGSPSKVEAANKRDEQPVERPFPG
jgi:tetratricopeptide (TPR) repeat protein